jgi:heat shock protein HtpX
MNAFSVGRRGEAAIALTDGLLRNLSRRELTGVLAHEIAHVQANDIWIMGIADSMGRLVWLGSLFGQVLLLVNLPLWFAGGHTLPWWPIVLLMAAPSLSALLQLGLSRAREFDADVSAAELTGDPEGLALSLDKLERAQHGWFERIFLPRGRQSQPSLLRTHPATEERIERLLALDQARRRGDEEEIPTPPEWRIGLLPDGWPVITRRPSRHWHGMWW